MVMNMAAKKKMSVAKKSHKVDMFKETLPALDCNDRDFYKNLSDESKKTIAMQEVVLRWLSCVGNYGKDNKFTEYYLIMTNEGPNMSFGYHELYGHEELEWMLLSIVGIGKQQNHSWIPSAPKSETPTIDAMFWKKYPLASIKEIKMLKSLASKEEILLLVSDYGNPDKLSSTEATKLKQKHGGVFDKKTVLAELKKIGK